MFNVYKIIGAGSIFLAAFVPYVKVPVISIPFHFSVVLLVLGFLFYLYRVGLSLCWLVSGFFLLVLSVTSAFYSAVLGLDFNLFSWGYKLVPVACLVFSFLICWYSSLSDSDLRKFFLILTVSFFFVSLLQFLPSLKGLFQAIGYISADRSEVWSRYYMLLAPMSNPNNSAAVAASLSLFAFLFWDVARKGTNFYVAFVLLSIPALIFLMLLGYARTVSAAFGCSLFIWLLIKGGFKVKLFLTFLLLMLWISIQSFESRGVSYYLTIFSALTDSSFTSRFDYWETVVLVLNEYPLSWLFGLARIQDALVQVSGKSVIDSSYIFILGQFGILVLLALMGLAAYFSLRSFRVFVFFIFLAICSISLAVFSDVRLSIIFGGLAGYIYSLSHPPARKVRYESQ